MQLGKMGARGGFGSGGALQGAGGPSDPVTTIGQNTLYTKGPFSAFLSTFNVGGITHTESLALHASTFPGNSDLTWNYQTGTTTIKGYMQVATYGDYFNTVPQTPITSQQVKSITALTATHNMTWSGNANGYDVIYDWFLTSAANAHVGAQHKFEVAVALHSPAYFQTYFASMTTIGTTTISGISWDVKIDPTANSGVTPYIIFMPTSRADVLAATIDMQAMHAYLIAQGTITGNEYYNGHALGAEIAQGTGTLHITSASVNYNSTASVARVMTNGNTLPFQLDTAQTNNVRNNRHRKYVAGPSDVVWFNNRLYFANWASRPTDEVITGLATITLKMGVEYNGSYYPVTFSAASSTSLAAGSGIWSDPIAGLLIDPSISRELYVDTNIVGPGVSTSYLRSVVSTVFLGEGTSNGTAAVDFTDGTLARGAKGAATVVGGSITAIAVTANGVNYTQNCQAYAVETVGGQEFQKLVGNAIFSGGGIASVTVTSGAPPTGLAAWVNPTIRIMFGTSKLTSAMTVAGHSSALLMGTPSRAQKATLLTGDSIVRGNGVSSVSPTLKSHAGIYEAGINNRVGTINFAIGSSLATGWGAMATTWPRLTALIPQANPTEAIHASGTNNLTANATSGATVITALGNTRTAIRTAVPGLPTSHGGTLPRNTVSSVDQWVNDQTPFNTAFQSGGDRDLVNAALTNGTIVSDIAVIRGDVSFADATNNYQFRKDIPSPATLYYFVQDGTHQGYTAIWFAQSDATWLAAFNPYAST